MFTLCVFCKIAFSNIDDNNNFFFSVSGKVGIPLTGLTTPVGWLSLPPTDRPKSVRSRYVIEIFGGVFVMSRCFFGFFCGYRNFGHGTESDLFLFLLPDILMQFRYILCGKVFNLHLFFAIAMFASGKNAYIKESIASRIFMNTFKCMY